MGNPISKTAYYTLACRYWDANSPKPLCNDTLAHLFMNDEAQALAERFKHLSKPNASIAARHRIISDYLDVELAQNPKIQIINIGCGFDTRPFRHTGGRWVEIDEASLIEYKNSCLPTSEAKNELTRIPIEFARESLAEKLAPFKTDEPVAIIAEGVTMYLTEAEQRSMLTTLQGIFPRHRFYCDIMTHSFFLKRSQELHEQIKTLGTSFKDISDTPEMLFHSLGYRTNGKVSSVLRSAELGAINIPAWLIRYFLRGLRDGLCVYAFECGAS